MDLPRGRPALLRGRLETAGCEVLGPAAHIAHAGAATGAATRRWRKPPLMPPSKDRLPATLGITLALGKRKLRDALDLRQERA